MMYTHTCLNCLKIFTSKKKNQKYCCHKCSCEDRIGKPKLHYKSKKVEVTCVQCGKKEMVYPARAKHYVCCSQTCLGKRNSIIYSQKVEKTCPICNKTYFINRGRLLKNKTCGSTECVSKWRSITYAGEGNSNYKGYEIIDGIKTKSYSRYSYPYKKITTDILNVKKLPKGYDIHHKDCDETNNDPANLVVIPHFTHMLIHRYLGNVLLAALHKGLVNRKLFFDICEIYHDKNIKKIYENIIDLNITHQVVVKQGELLGSPGVDNQQPSIYRNIIEGSTTNGRILTENAEDSNADTSALPISNNGDDIV